MSTQTTSRREFLKGSGCLLIGFSMVGGAPSVSEAQQARRPRLPGSLGSDGSIDSWLRINADGTVTVFSGKVELGQGIRTALAQIAAEELDVSLERVRMVMGDTATTPNEGYTAGSMSIEQSGAAIRHAAAEARQLLAELAATKLGTTADRIEVRDGKVSARGAEGSTSYWDLIGGKRLERRATGTAPLKRPEQHTIVGKPVERLEIPDIVTGRQVYVHDLRPAGMLHARVVRPPSRSATLKSIPEDEVAGMPGVVKIVRDGSFVAVVAAREEQAVWAAERLRAGAAWSESDDLPELADLYKHLRSLPAEQRTIRSTGNVEEALRRADVRVEASYSRPYQMHASIGPSCAVAQMRDEELTVWSHTQGVYPLRQSLANLLGMAANKVRVIGVPGSGCYGHNGADDVAADAALLARAVPPKPIRVQWSRQDEHMWEPYGSAMMFDIRGGLDAAGNIVAWDYQLWSDSAATRPGGDASAFLAAHYLSKPRTMRTRGYSAGSSRNAEALYELPNQRIAARAFSGPLRVSALRSLGAYGNIFAIESFMDELAEKAKADPVEFRLRHLKDARGREVIQAAAKAIGWDSEKPPAGRGRGMGFTRYKNYATYCAVCAEVEVGMPGGDVRLLRLVAAVDSGQVINPDGLRNQIEGGMIQSASWTLREQVQFDRRRVTSNGWHAYPILRFADVPQVEVLVLDHPNEPSVGAGEAAAGPTAAAIANAVCRSCGRRVRDLPITPEKIRSAAGGKA